MIPIDCYTLIVEFLPLDDHINLLRVSKSWRKTVLNSKLQIPTVIYIIYPKDLENTIFSQTKKIKKDGRSFVINPIQSYNLYRQPFKHQFELQYSKNERQEISWVKENEKRILILVQNEIDDEYILPNLFLLKPKSNEKEIQTLLDKTYDYIISKCKIRNYTFSKFINQKKKNLLSGDLERNLQDFYDPIKDQSVFVQYFFIRNFLAKNINSKFKFEKNTLSLEIEKEVILMPLHLKSSTKKEYSFDQHLGRVIERNKELEESDISYTQWICCFCK